LEFRIDEYEYKIGENNKRNLINTGKNNYSIQVLFQGIIRRFTKSYNHINSRNIDLTEELNNEIIFSLFPKKILHNCPNGKREDIDLMDFIKTHMTLASGYTNPRIIILFLNKLFNNLSIYYHNNPDIEVRLNNKGTYDLIPADIFINSYSEFRESLKTIFQRLDKKWNDWFVKFEEIKGLKITFKYLELFDAMKINKKDEEEFKRFLTFFVHSGLLGCPDLQRTIN
jgi:hypothetical protein